MTTTRSINDHPGHRQQLAVKPDAPEPTGVTDTTVPTAAPGATDPYPSSVPRTPSAEGNTVTNSIIARRMVGRGLKHLREHSRIAAGAAARELEIAPQTLWRVETGQKTNILKRVYIKALCHLYSAPEETTATLLTLARQTKNRPWWHKSENIVEDHAELLLSWEDHAQHVTTFHPDLIPPVVQTPGYRRASAWAESPDLPPEQADRMLEFLDHRQAHLLDRAPTAELRAILRETALHDMPGGPQVREDQLAHLVALAQRPGVCIRIIPRHAGIHPGLLVGAFDLLEFPEHPIPALTEPPVVHVPAFTKQPHYLDRGTDITRYCAALTEIYRTTLEEDDSRKLLLDIADENRRHSDGGVSGD